HDVGVDVGLVDPGVRADPAVMGLGDQDALVHAHDSPRLAQNHLDQPWILGESGRHRQRDRRGLDVRELHEPALGLRHDLLADHEQIAGHHGRPLALGGVDDQPRDVVARPYLPDALHADDFVAGHDWSEAHATLPGGRLSAARSRQLETRRPVSVALRSASSAERSSGASTSSPSPGSESTRGARPRWRAVARWRAKDGSPNVSGIASGGASATPLVPSPERDGANTGAPARTPSMICSSSSVVTHGTSPGSVRNPRAPSAAHAAVGSTRYPRAMSRAGPCGGAAAPTREPRAAPLALAAAPRARRARRPPRFRARAWSWGSPPGRPPRPPARAPARTP